MLRSAPPSESQPVALQRTRVLIVEDDESVGLLLQAELVGLDVELCTSGDDALRTLDGEPFDVVVTDLYMPGMNGLDLCERIGENHPDLPVLVLTAHGRLDTAVAAIRAGAYDFLVKPPAVESLVVAIERAVENRSLKREVTRLRSAVRNTSPFEGVLGESVAMQRVYDLLARVAESDTTLLITGESGTGKENVARAVHARSRRSAGPMVAVNCAALPENLLESELFGHVKGAFTDARTSKQGLFAMADGGTILLDEVGEMPMGMQPKLLRALQERTIRPIGANKEIPIDVRIVAATNVDLHAAIAEKKFREDLFFRISVIQIELPPLRARGNDVLLLAQHFIEHFAKRAGKSVRGLAPATAQRLLGYAWPGNVRELQNVVERAVVLTSLDQIGVDDLPDRVRAVSARTTLAIGGDASELVPMDEVERRYIARVLEAVNGNKTTAARVLGFDRTTLYRKLERYGLGDRASDE
jgi:DNA-binding NtrC family response regulator